MSEIDTNFSQECELGNPKKLTITKPKHFNHKQWRAYLKKMKRKEKRTAAAKERERQENNEAADDLKSDSEEEREREREENESRIQNELWLERERQAQAAFKAKKEREEFEKKRIEEIERKIKEEWEERERKEKEDREAKEKQEQEKRLKQDKLLKEATANENPSAWHNPIAPVHYGTERQVDACPFFKKMAACRFGDHCSRFHDYPEVSHTILIPNMFSSFQLEQSIVDNYDTDVSLEYDENELYNSFKDFYEDIVPEFKSVGTIVQLKVCCNCEPHLRGNVYVQYKRESAAQKAFEKFNARWYASRQLTCIFVNIESWKSAICGLASKKRCPKGKSCNFLHVFRNPGGEFTELDYDDVSTDRSDRQNGKDRAGSQRHYSRDSVQHGQSRRQSSSSYQSSRHRSRSPSSSRSRSSSRRSHSSRKSTHYRSRSRSRSRDRTHRYDRPRSRSPRQRKDSQYSPEPQQSRKRYSSRMSEQNANKNETVADEKHSRSNKSKSSLLSSSPSSNSGSESDKSSSESNSDSSSDEEIVYEYIEKTKETLHH
uniref:Uncharacterized protein n=1 Tax=Biomphalaria glabrata TaxID=6526 RepID=A0A2C9JJH9_BIOGL